MNRVFVMASIGVVCALSSAWADDSTGKPQVHKLTVRPAAEPIEALKYELFPQRLARSPGNAATYYYRAILLHNSLAEEVRKEFNKKHEEATGGDFDARQMKEWLMVYEPTLLELQRATNREYCKWDLRIEDIKGPKAIQFLLPELQELRQLGRLLQLKFQVELAEGNIEAAIETLRMNYQLGVDAGNERLLINALVGLAIVGISNGSVEQLIQHKDCPNLYWALAGLPNPVVDLKPAMEVEMTLCERMFPMLKDPLSRHLSSDEWMREVNAAWKMSRELSGSNAPNSQPWDTTKLAGAALVVRGYPKAKQGLIDMGFDEKDVEAMPTGKVIAVYQSRIHEHVYSESSKWHRLPYYQVREHMQRTQRRLIDEGYLKGVGKEVIPIVSLLLPAVSASHEAQVRTQRAINVMRLIEAVRMHAAANNGQAPETLDDLKIVPAPLDPYWGKPFVYRKTKAGCVIEALTDQPSLSNIYEVTIIK